MSTTSEKDLSVEILSNITVYMKYAKYVKSLQRRETWDEIVDRNMQMHIEKYPQLKEEITVYYENFVRPKKVLPSMRSLQFAGKPIKVNPTRIYNCCYLPIEDWVSFSEIMFLLLGGTGVGYSVQKHHVDKLPEIKAPNKDKRKRYLIGDSIEGWADAIKVLMKSYFFGLPTVVFDYSDIREKGAELVTSGGKAPGPQPLKDCIHNITKILDSKQSYTKLTSLEVHDIICHIADAVLAGGIRRAALISLFSADDMSMITCKSGSWWELNPQRGRANNSAVLDRNKITKEFFFNLWDRIEKSGSGEPGFYFTNNKDWGTNPCCEIALRPYQFCNLTEINVSNIDETEFYKRCQAAAFIGTLQAGYTDFHYLRPIWKKTTEKDALLGVSMTGIASMKILKPEVLKTGASIVTDVNEEVSSLIGINKASRSTCVKPAGTTSLVLGTSSGIHAWHNDYYIRRIRIGKNEALYTYLMINHPELVKDEYFRPDTMAVIEIPQKAPEGAVLRNESPLSLLERVKQVSSNWISNGHKDGQNTHNVSATISINKSINYVNVPEKPVLEMYGEKPGSKKYSYDVIDEWQVVGEWMWENKDHYNGLSVLPYDGGTYIQAPFEDITKDKFNELLGHLTSIDLSKVIEINDTTNLKDQAACAGGACEIV